MFRADHVTKKTDANGAGKDGYTEGSVATQVAPTVITADAMNALQEELCAIVEGAGITLSKPDNGQALTAIESIVDDAVRSYPTDVIAPAAIGASQNNWNPTGLSAANVLIVTTSVADLSITGLVPSSTIGVVYLLNGNASGSHKFTLEHEHASSTAANRFYGMHLADVRLGPGDGVLLVRDPNASRWRVISGVMFSQNYALEGDLNAEGDIGSEGQLSSQLDVTADGSVYAGQDVTAQSGDVSATAGDVSAGNDVVSAKDVYAGSASGDEYRYGTAASPAYKLRTVVLPVSQAQRSEDGANGWFFINADNNWQNDGSGVAGADHLRFEVKLGDNSKITRIRALVKNGSTPGGGDGITMKLRKVTFNATSANSVSTIANSTREATSNTYAGGALDSDDNVTPIDPDDCEIQASTYQFYVDITSSDIPTGDIVEWVKVTYQDFGPRNY